MFIWDFSAIFAVVLIVSLGVVFAGWLFYTFNGPVENHEYRPQEHFRQCQYCGHVYMDYLKRAPCRCPQCLSYHDL